jgi:hypothetical protein
LAGGEELKRKADEQSALSSAEAAKHLFGQTAKSVADACAEKAKQG